MRIKLVVAYDGTEFRGWAAQAGQRTVHGTLTEAVRRATGEDVEIVGASRTDSGAHAAGQVAHLDTTVGMEPARWARVLNRLLPPDLRVVDSCAVDGSFHARFCAESRRYEYRILRRDGDPFAGRTSHLYTKALDLGTMQRAGHLLVGKHDFEAYTEELDPALENTTRTLHSVELHEKDAVLTISIRGTAFLRGMMRRMSGALLEVGRGHRPPEEVGLLLTEARETLQWPVVLPAKGLTLMEVAYADPPRDIRTASSLA